MSKKNGGRKVASGGDTCIYAPAVACEGEGGVRTPDSVSRIIPRGLGGHDIAIEVRIARDFPELVRGGYVTVHTKSCTPDFQGEDFDPPAKRWDNKYACTRTVNPTARGPDRAYTNLITPKRLGDGFALPPTNENFAGAFAGAIGLVPDDGPWIIHGDLHLGNVLYSTDVSGNNHTGLSDWGRSFVIENPNDMNSIKAGLLTFFQRWGYSNKQNFDDAFREFRALARLPTMRWHPVAPRELLMDIINIFDDPGSVMNDVETNALSTGVKTLEQVQLRVLRRFLRGWNALALANAIKIKFAQDNQLPRTPLGPLDSLYKLPGTQAELLAAVNRIHGLNVVIPRRPGAPPPRPPPAPPPPPPPPGLPSSVLPAGPVPSAAAASLGRPASSVSDVTMASRGAPVSDASAIEKRKADDAKQIAARQAAPSPGVARAAPGAVAAPPRLADARAARLRADEEAWARLQADVQVERERRAAEAAAARAARLQAAAAPAAAADPSPFTFRPPQPQKAPYADARARQSRMRTGGGGGRSKTRRRIRRTSKKRSTRKGLFC